MPNENFAIANTRNATSSSQCFFLLKRKKEIGHGYSNSIYAIPQRNWEEFHMAIY